MAGGANAGQRAEESNSVSEWVSATDDADAASLATPEPLVSIHITAELRWFFDGPLPEAVHSWFTEASTRGLSESRRDAYRHDNLVDVGVKRRFGTTLELKKRLDAPEPAEVGGMSGQIETWRRWSPADHLVAVAADTLWIDVDKTVIKRRFDKDGREISLTEENRAMTGQGCDAEIVALSVCGRPAWSLAFAAFGPVAVRRGYLLDTWRESILNAPSQPHLDFSRAVPFGYPEWLVEISTSADVVAVDRSA